MFNCHKTVILGGILVFLVQFSRFSFNDVFIIIYYQRTTSEWVLDIEHRTFSLLFMRNRKHKNMKELQHQQIA